MKSNTSASVKAMEARNELLSLLVGMLSRKEYLDKATELIKKWVDVSHVGIRVLDEKRCIPYETCLGFDREFLKTEDKLFVEKNQGICTRIISGKMIPQDKLAMTRGGSFYSGDMENFMKKLTMKERVNFRGVCLKKGFMSMAIIPVRYDGETLGAIHLADRKIGKIDIEKVEFIESLAPFVAEMINKYNIQDKIKSSEEKYRELVENANSIILRLDSQGRVTFFNEFAQKFFGFSEKEILGKNSVGTIVPEKDSTGRDLGKMIKKIIKNTGQFEYNENENIKKDGSKVWVAWNNKAVFDKNEKLLHILCIGSDITDKKNLEESGKKANRALKMLTECNRVIIYGKKEKTLLDEVCRIIVETGGYVMAWVGEAKNDAYKSVVPIAQSGFEGGYLKNANVSWSKRTVKGRGPTGISIREGRISIGENFHKDRKLSLWRERAIKRGYASSIALPLKSEGEVFGSLAIYASKPYAFSNPEEVRLLSELAENLSFGITTIRVRKYRERAEEQLIESYKHLGVINRKIPLLLDIEQRGRKKNKKEISSYILRSAINLSQANIATMHRLEDDNVFRILTCHGLNNTQKNRIAKIKHKDCKIFGLLTKQKKMIKGSAKEYDLGKIDSEGKLKYFIMLPLGLDKKPGGVLFLGFTDKKSMESQDLEFLDVFSIHASSALFNARVLKYR